MRAIVVGPVAAWSVADVWRGWCRGLVEAGATVLPFKLTDRYLFYESAVLLDDDAQIVKSMDRHEAMTAATRHILAAAYEFCPDVVFVIHGASIDPHELRKLRCPIVVVMTECPYEDQMQTAWCQGIEPTLILLNDPTHQGVYGQIAPAFYAPHAYDPTVHHPGPSADDHDCVFVGTGFPNRVDWLSRVDWTDIGLALAGDWARLDGTDLARFVLHADDLGECISNDRAAELYRGARTGFNVYRRTADGEHSTPDAWAIGPREVEMAACGLWFARQSGPESDEVLSMLPAVSTPEELGDVIRWGLTHRQQAEDAAAAAFRAVADRTFAHHARRTLRRLEAITH